MPREWWESFFSDLWLEVQRQIRVEETPAEADFIEKVLELNTGDKVLDVPCGEGRLSLELASRGYRLTGLDITPPLLEDARRQADERGLDIAFKGLDMRHLPWEGEFDGAFCFWGSFGYFDDDGNREFLGALSRVLKPDGRALLDIPNLAEGVLPRFQERGWDRVGDILVLQERKYNHAQGRIDVEWTFVQGDRTEKMPSSIQLYTYRELCRLLKEVGLVSWKEYGSLDLKPFGLGSRLYLVVRRK